MPKPEWANKIQQLRELLPLSTENLLARANSGDCSQAENLARTSAGWPSPCGSVGSMSRRPQTT